MKIYVAGASSERARVRVFMERSIALGCTITHDWTPVVERFGSCGEALSHDQLRAEAMCDLRGIRDAEAVVVLAPCHEAQTIGAWIELGYALGCVGNERTGRPNPTPIAVVGPVPTPFVFLCNRLSDDNDALEWLRSWTYV
jgi:hypothetical protein